MSNSAIEILDKLEMYCPEYAGHDVEFKALAYSIRTAITALEAEVERLGGAVEAFFNPDPNEICTDGNWEERLHNRCKKLLSTLTPPQGGAAAP